MNKITFSLNKNDVRFNMLDDDQKALVEAGVEAVKKYVAEKSQATKNKTLYSLLSDVKTDDRKKLDNEVVNKMVKYSLKKAGINTDNFSIENIKNPMLHGNTIFRETFNVILAQIMTPVIPAMVSAQYMDIADISNIGWGDTARFKVNSNDTFFVHRIAEGINQGSVQRIYNDELTVNPEPYNIKTTIDWYQVAAGVFDLGEFVYRVGVSFSAYICQMVVTALTQYVQDGVGSAYFVDGFTTTTFAHLADILRAANGGARVHAYGTLPALSTIIPYDKGSTANMQMQLGEEWSKVGYISTYMDVDLIRIPQILLPNTVNTAPLVGIPDSVVYMFADGGYKPVKLVFEGSPITISIEPTDSPDKEMGINVTSRFGQTLVAASKFGAITLAGE